MFLEWVSQHYALLTNHKPGLGVSIWSFIQQKRSYFLIPCSGYRPLVMKNDKAICCKADPFFSLFFVTLIVDTMLSFHFVKLSHYFSILFESHLHSKFKGSSDWLIGKCDYICNYIDTYSKLMWSLHCELTPRNLDNYLCDCIMLLWAKCQHKRWAIGGLQYCTDSCTQSHLLHFD